MLSKCTAKRCTYINFMANKKFTVKLTDDDYKRKRREETKKKQFGYRKYVRNCAVNEPKEKMNRILFLNVALYL